MRLNGFHNLWYGYESRLGARTPLPNPASFSSRSGKTCSFHAALLITRACVGNPDRLAARGRSPASPPLSPIGLKTARVRVVAEIGGRSVPSKLDSALRFAAQK